MTEPRQPIANSGRRPSVVAIAGVAAMALALSILSPVTGASIPTSPPGAATAVDLGAPSIQYQEARAHAGDANRFAAPNAGDPAVTVPLRTRDGTPSAVRGIVPAARSTLQAASSGLRREVFGFLPYWQLGDSTTRLDYATLSTIAYFSVGVDRNGNLVKANGDGSASTG
jgi:hypothetical protein